MNEYDELMTEENEIEAYDSGKDMSAFVGAGAIAGAAILGYEGVKQLGKRVIKPGFAKAKTWWQSKHGAKPEAVEVVEEVAEVEEK